jgi:hypothetical protein
VRQSFDEVEKLLKEVKPFLLRVAVSEKSCSMPTGQIDLVDSQRYIEAFDFLYDLLKSEEWAEVQKHWGWCKPEVWAAYDLNGVTGLHEQRLLNTACQKLAKYWRTHKPNGFFGKHVDEPTAEDLNQTEETSDQGGNPIPDDKAGVQPA